MNTRMTIMNNRTTMCIKLDINLSLYIAENNMLEFYHAHSPAFTRSTSKT